VSAAPVRSPRRPAAPRPKPAPRKPAPKKKKKPSAAPWPGLRLVPPPGLRRPRLRRLMAVGLAGMVAVGLLGLAGLHAVLATDQVKLDRLEARVAVERDRFAARRLDVATLESPQRVRRAAERLGLVSPPPGGSVYLVPSEATVRAVDGLPPPDEPAPPSPQLRADPAPTPAPATPPVVAAVPADPAAAAPAPAPAPPTPPATPAPPPTPAAPAPAAPAAP
jgi:hypothetical protein